MNKRAISLAEITIILVSIIAFSYLIAQTDIKPVSAASTAAASASTTSTGCCQETKSGAICQDVNLFDASLCKTDLIGTSCNFVSECQKGCCYSQDSGVCTLNSPKDKCESAGAKWSDDATCNIDACQMGCCVLGDGASMTTSKECTLLSKQYYLTKNFLPLDRRGSCDLYTDLSDEGACLLPSADFSDQKNCIFTTKGKCNGDFRKGYLCTSKELNTSCEKTAKTSCFEGKDQVYYLDSCGNRANVFDSNKYDNQNYWEKYISPSQSCQSFGTASCGNCNYQTGSVCDKFAQGRNDLKLDSGDYTCRNLNCAGGRKNGESWCVSDYNTQGIASAQVGARQYLAKCSEGTISIDGCADFNQEICIQSSDTTFNYSEAKCTPNEWRSCVEANNYDNYNQVKQKCSQLSQCVMFNDIPGNEIYTDLPGFKEILNDNQGRAGAVGKGTNKVIPYCVPRYTPGYQFWTTSSDSSSGSKSQIESTQNYGGSKKETDSICSLGSFTCASHIEITSPLINPTPHDRENPECNINAVESSNQKVSLMMQALNERCRSLGSCGIQTNTQGQLGTSSGFSVTRTFIDTKGKSHPNFPATEYVVPNSYINSTVKAKQAGTPMGQLKNLSQVLGINNQGSVIFELASTLITGYMIVQPAITGNQITAQFPNQVDTTAVATQGSQEIAASAADQAQMGEMSNQLNQGVGSLAGIGVASGIGTTAATYTVTSSAGEVLYSGTSAINAASTAAAESELGAVTTITPGATTSVGSALTNIGITAIAAVAGYFIGGMIAKATGMTPGQTTAFVGVMSSAFAIGASLYIGITTTLGVIGLVISVIMMIYSAFSGVDNEYYIQTFTCAAWQPPRKGDCNACNSDVRPCSEDKCRSIGQNCHYFLDNGEPGYCASISDIWSAKISPWNDVITSGLKYSNVTSFGLKVQATNAVETPAWQQVSFGITTDKEAICKLDTDHSRNFDSMAYILLSDKNYATGKIDGMHHRIILSPSAIDMGNQQDFVGTTPPLKEGENIYFIKCRNFAGQENEAPFTVKVVQARGPDLTPAQITRFIPEVDSYLAQGTTGAQLMFYLNEPAECKYAVEYDYPKYEDMPNNFSCITDPSAAYYGEWPCYGVIQNITDKTQIFVKCKDQPALIETTLLQRNANPQSIPYTFNICSDGLTISSTNPASGEEIDSATSGANLTVKTSGCIEGGKAYCQYSIPSFGNYTSAFLQTGGTTHIQPLSTLGAGNHEVQIFCQDDAGNRANTTLNFTLNIDTSAPQILRIYTDSSDLILKTDENAACLFSINESTGCDFNLNSGDLSFTKIHSAPLEKNIQYFVKCVDDKGNAPSGCTEIIKPTS